MSVRAIKTRVFAAARALQLERLVRASRWRSHRLLILCYHGVSLHDEHEWDSALYMSPQRFRSRMEAIHRGGYRVLPLDEALIRLADGTLPPLSVSLTFDDGFADFRLVAYPILRDFGFPATVYLYSYYVGVPYSVWPPIGRYLLWKGRGQSISGDGLVGDGAPIRSSTIADRSDAMSRMHASLAVASAEDREKVATTLAERLGIDYAAIKSRRVLQLMRPDEVAELDRDLVDIQLHTHHHRQPNVRAQYDREIADNRAAIEELVGRVPPRRHFCYPSGVVRPELPEWLRSNGVVSATTCASGLAARDTDRWRLPRFVDTHDVTPSEFEAWLSGFAALLPRRA